MPHWTTQLNTFTDTTDLCHATESVLMTQGIKFIVKHANAKWLPRAMAACLLRFDAVGFVTVTLHPHVTGATLTLRDEQGKVLMQQDTLARFELAEIRFPCLNMDENWLIMLPSEHDALRAECSASE